MVDRILIERILSDIKSNVQELRQADDITFEIYQTDKRSRRFIERTLHILVEACIDIAQHLISDNHFREPTGYRDSFVVLAEEGVLQTGDLPGFERMASFRNLLVHYYERIDDEIVYGVFKSNLTDFDLFVERIVSYLKKTEIKK